MTEREATNEINVSDASLEILSTFERVKAAVEHLLVQKGKNSEKKTISGPELRAAAKEAFPSSFGNVADNTFSQYLSNFAKEPQSNLFSAGKRKGYYWSEDKPKIGEDEPSAASETTNNQRIEREKRLYPVVESWLITQECQTKDVSTQKGNGKWGNPDILGIRILDTFDGTAIELTSIEVKTSNNNWQQFIFEAISHRRFANRSYFAFLHPESLREKLDIKNFRYYCELYRIGIILMLVDDDVFKEITEGNAREDLKSDDVDIIEILPAPYNSVPPERQFEFLRIIGVDTKKKLMQFGFSTD